MFEIDGRPVEETRDVTGAALPGCSPETHYNERNKKPGEHTALCIAGILGYHEEDGVWRRNPPEPMESPGDVLEHDGYLYVRPVGRGVVLEGDPDRYLEDLPEGRYRATIRLERVTDA